MYKNKIKICKGETVGYKNNILAEKARPKTKTVTSHFINYSSSLLQ